MKIKKIRHKVTKAQSGKEEEKYSVPLCLCAPMLGYGVRQNRRTSAPVQKGFTLMELMVVIAIIILLAGIMVPNLAHRLERAKMTKAEADIASIEGAIAMYETDTGRYPEDTHPTLLSIEVLAWRLTARDRNGNVGLLENLISNDPNWHGPYLKGIEKDPWGNYYVYVKNTGGVVLPPTWWTVAFTSQGNPGGCVAPPYNLSYYIYSLGKNKSTGGIYDGVVNNPVQANDDDINNWDVNKKWREAY